MEHFTDNGAVTLGNTGNACLNLFAMIGSCRDRIEDLQDALKHAFKENSDLATRIVLWARDCRGGAGERETFRFAMTWLVDIYPEIADAIFMSDRIETLGRWDDYITLLTNENLSISSRIVKAEKLRKSLENNEPGSNLLAKWLPRKGMYAAIIRDLMRLSPKQYRKLLVSRTNVVETKMCQNKWNEIELEHVPSLALSRLGNAFNRHIPEKMAQFKEDLATGKTKAKANQVFPHDLIVALRAGNDEIANEQWKNLPDFLDGNKSLFPIVDVSGSMEANVPRSSAKCMDVAIGLGLYCAERATGLMEGKIMTFEHQPSIVTIKGKTLTEKYWETKALSWGTNTDLQFAFRTLLKFLKKVDPKDHPDNILIISDMEFDEAVADKTNFQVIEKQYKQAGIKRPNLVFWNVAARSKNFQVKKDENGSCMISGFSPAILKSVLVDDINSMKIMLESVMKDRYTI